MSPVCMPAPKFKGRKSCGNVRVKGTTTGLFLPRLRPAGILPAVARDVGAGRESDVCVVGAEARDKYILAFRPARVGSRRDASVRRVWRLIGSSGVSRAPRALPRVLRVDRPEGVGLLRLGVPRGSTPV